MVRLCFLALDVTLNVHFAQLQEGDEDQYGEVRDEGSDDSEGEEADETSTLTANVSHMSS